MKLSNYIIVTHSDGRYKVYTAERYRLLRILKSIGVILGTLLVAILFCGAALTSEHPAKWLQVVLVFGLSAFVLTVAIVLSVTGGDNKRAPHSTQRTIP